MASVEATERTLLVPTGSRSKSQTVVHNLRYDTHVYSIHYSTSYYDIYEWTRYIHRFFLDQIAVGNLLWWYGVCVLVHFLAHPVPPF